MRRGYLQGQTGFCKERNPSSWFGGEHLSAGRLPALAPVAAMSAGADPGDGGPDPRMGPHSIMEVKMHGADPPQECGSLWRGI